MYLISVVITTYNWPSALSLCVESLLVQQDRNFEIIIADDGSSENNIEIAKSYCLGSPISISYIHHDDQGFRAGTIRNKAVAACRGEYLLFIDGDCIVLPDFIAKHRQLALRGFFVPGNRVLLSQEFTQEVIEQHLELYAKPIDYFILLWLQKKINRLLGFFYLPLGLLRYLRPKKWKKAMTCNLGIWKSDFLMVNGFDELFEGWGYEDSDLVIRLIHAGIKRKEGRFAVPVLHLWHSQNDKSNQDINYQRLIERSNNLDFIIAKKGVSQYIE
jgi:glycosyltransferase involved in cell wall biosynthesis